MSEQALRELVAKWPHEKDWTVTLTDNFTMQPCKPDCHRCQVEIIVAASELRQAQWSDVSGRRSLAVVNEDARKLAERACDFILLNGSAYAGFKTELYASVLATALFEEYYHTVKQCAKHVIGGPHEDCVCVRCEKMREEGERVRCETLEEAAQILDTEAKRHRAKNRPREFCAL